MNLVEYLFYVHAQHRKTIRRLADSFVVYVAHLSATYKKLLIPYAGILVDAVVAAASEL